MLYPRSVEVLWYSFELVNKYQTKTLRRYVMYSNFNFCQLCYSVRGHLTPQAMGDDK